MHVVPQPSPPPPLFNIHGLVLYPILMLCRVQLFQRFEKFRVIVLGGDGSIGWVMSTLDKYNLHSKVREGLGYM